MAIKKREEAKHATSNPIAKAIATNPLLSLFFRIVTLPFYRYIKTTAFLLSIYEKGENVFIVFLVFPKLLGLLIH